LAEELQKERDAATLARELEEKDKKEEKLTRKIE